MRIANAEKAQSFAEWISPPREEKILYSNLMKSCASSYDKGFPPWDFFAEQDLTPYAPITFAVQ